MRWIWRAVEFLQKIRGRLRFGEESRAPLKFLRLELREDSAECEWIARANDPWDADLPIEIREENETLQALRDALAVREFLFSSLSEVHSATFRVYRTTEWGSRQLIITGSVSCDDNPPPRIASLVMRAKLYGLHFRLENGALAPLHEEQDNFELATEMSWHENR